MMEAYSPQRDSESPLHSPHRLRYCDSHPALGEIQRSLSRSPSKNSLRGVSPHLSQSQYQPSPLSPSRRSTSDFVLQSALMTSPFASRNINSSRFSRPGMRRTAQTTGTLRTRTSPKSPSKRVLTDSSDSGNSTPMPLRKRSSTEADREQSLKGSEYDEDKENSSSQEDGVQYRAYTRQEKRRSGGSLMSFIPQSPMKRHDPPSMDLESDFKSPSAKRRSLHAPTMDFSIFESDNLSSSISQHRTQDDNDWLRTASPGSSSRFSTIPKRSSSLRKSTVQQRPSEKPSTFKFNQLLDIESAWTQNTPKTNKGLRMSLDNHIEPLPRDSPFSAQGHLLSASIHPASSAINSQVQNVASQQSRHPLSRTMTQSSSASSFQDESPTHEPVHRPVRPKSYDFSKSLPVGAERPSPSEESSQESSQGSFATPGNYKSARPLPAAFMSTGLISKKNRNVNDPNGGLPKAHMPDTPCKKPTIMFPAETKFKKSILGRAGRESFGVPASPYEPSGSFSKPSAFPFGRSGSIFGVRTAKPSLMRKASFASIESEEKVSRSPSQPTESQSTGSDFPPTPTKHLEELERKASISPSPELTRTLSVHRFSQGSQYATSKLSPVQASPDCMDGDSDSVMEDSPSANLRPKSLRVVTALKGTSFTQGRALKNLCSPTPLSRRTSAFPALQSHAKERAKSSAISPATPQVDQFAPHTPLEGYFPPDPSGLSISGRGERPPTRTGTPVAVPATPTGPREYFPNFSHRTSVNLQTEATNLDSSLTSRFEKVDLIGTGEFSSVYRVSVPPQASPFRKIYAVSGPKALSRTSTGITDERVFAVKKSKYPYNGPRDRQWKIEEVNILKALRHADHVLAFVDSWEHDSHLYIQTEFCEEGTLDVFLRETGDKARLDDFRIWKILLEMTQGLKHIHESGFIHLDMKPSNVLITFDGVLKISDFGMATKWPAKAGIEGEGDREYIGPEVLMGKYDMPADIFALGLMILEIAGNVVLPDNGASWQKLRSGDMSDVPSLTWSSGVSSILRDASGNPLTDAIEVSIQDDHDMGGTTDETDRDAKGTRNGELLDPPDFMTNVSNPQALDSLVKWMISPSPKKRPLAREILLAEGVQFVEGRRRAGATVFEGNWGPADEVLAEDAEMIDV